MPGWRDFERTIAIGLNGIALESKYIYDVLLRNPEEEDRFFGVSCKMRGMLSQVDRDGRVTIELSNASGEFWDVLKPLSIDQQNYQNFARIVGKTIVECVEGWHYREGIENGGKIETQRSIFLVLQYHPKKKIYQLFQFPILLPDPNTIEWRVEGRRLFGIQNNVIIMEWYGFSGGQLKYYPHYRSATWISQKFELEPIPTNIENGIINKAKGYFPEKWSKLENL